MFPWCPVTVPPEVPSPHPVSERKRRIFAQAMHARTMRVRRRRGT